MIPITIKNFEYKDDFLELLVIGNMIMKGA